MVMRIKALREAQKISQTELAAKMGVAQNAISQWESEVALPRARDLPRLADHLGCTIDDLFDRDDPRQTSA